MADSHWQALTAPFRRATSTLHASAAALRELGNDTAFWHFLAPLDSLPESVDFQAFGATAQWQVDLAPEEPKPRAALQPSTSFIERISKRARQRGQFAVVSKAQTGVPAQDEKKSGSHPLSTSASTESKQTTTAAQSATATQSIPRTQPGAWTVLERIAELTELLEQTPKASGNSTGTESEQSTRATGATAQARTKTAQRQSRSTAVPTGPTQASKSAGTPSPGSKRAPSRADNQPQPAAGLNLLAEYVTKLWHSPDPDKASKHQAGQDKSSTAAAAAQAAPKPAPRAPSLLQTSQAFLASETTEVGMRPGGTAANTEPGGSTHGKVTEEQAASSIQRPKERHEDLEERINRALIEQAWLRGVDLT